MPDYGGVWGGLRGIWVKSGGIGGEKQPKTCVWVLAVGGRAFLQRSREVKRHVFLLRLDTWTRGRLKSEFAIYAVRSGRINVAGINRQY